MPNWKHILRSRLARLSIHPARAEEIAEELASDLEEKYRRAVASGATPQQAEQQIVRELGAGDDLEQRIRELERWTPPQQEWGGPRKNQKGSAHMAANLWQDLRYGARTLSKSPWFTVVAVLTLALGIGANTAVFSAVYGVLLKPLAFPEPDRLVWTWGKFSGGNRGATSPPDFLDYRAQAKSFDGFVASVGGSGDIPMALTGSGDPTYLSGAVVTHGFLELLGGKAILGRTFLPEEEKDGGDGVVVISQGLWERRFGSDPGVIGRAVNIDARSRVIVGVVSSDFKYPARAQLWLPVAFGNKQNSVRRFHFLRALGRLRTGVSIEQAQAELEAIGTQLEKQYPDSNTTWRMRLVPLKDIVVGEVRPALLAIMAAVAFVLLIACVNVANLLLARGSGRQREIAIRLALGASRSRIISQLLAESSILALASTAVGLVLAYWSIAWIHASAPAFLPRRADIRIDSGTLAFTVAASLFTWLLFSLMPAVQSLRQISPTALRESWRTTASLAHSRLRGALVVAEVALSLVLLIGAGLLLRTFWNLTQVDLGFRPENLLITNISLPAQQYGDPGKSSAFFRVLYEKLAAVPGIEAAGGTNQPPLLGFNDTYFTIAGRAPRPDGSKMGAQQRMVGHGYFPALGSRIVAGRIFAAQDSLHSPKVVVVNDSFAREFFPNENPLGKVLHIDMGEPFIAEIIGVVAGARQIVPEAPFAEMYMSQQQMPIAFSAVLIRTSLPPEKLTASVRAVIHELNPNLPVEDFNTMENVAAGAIAQQRFSATLMAAFALVAMVLAAVGMTGVLAHGVAQRTHEIGVRMALGAGAGNVVRMILAQGMKLALLGTVIGAAGALALARTMVSMLFGVQPHDALTFTAVCVFLLLVAGIACWIPARRAAQVDPMIALRHE